MILFKKKTSIYQIYCSVILISVFGLNTYGEALNTYGLLSYLLLTLSNLFFATYLGIHKTLNSVNIFWIFIMIFIFCYSLLYNNDYVKIITDILQLSNVLLIAKNIRYLNKEELLKLIKIVCYVLFLAGIVSWLYYGSINKRFQPISYVVILYFFYELINNKFKWRNVFILLFTFYIIIDSGRRTNILLSLLGITILLYYYYRTVVIYILIGLTLLMFNKDSIQTSFKKSEYKTLKRLSITRERDQSMDTRIFEINSVLNKFKESNSSIIYLFGFGAGAEYYYNDPNLPYRNHYKHHIHFTPVNLYFRHGFIGLGLILIIIINTLLLFINYHSKTILFLNILVFVTIIDSFFRSVLVDFLGIFLLSLGLLLKRYK